MSSSRTDENIRSRRESTIEIEAALKHWKRSLPNNLKLELIHPRSSSYRATFHLYLNYHFAWITTGKANLVKRVRSYLQIHLSQRAQAISVDYTDDVSKPCVKAAKKILRLYEDVRRTGNLTRFSFTDFQGCSVATSLVLLASILDRDLDFERHINFGLDSLRRMAEGNATAMAGLKFVEALQSIAKEAVQRLHQVNMAASTTEQPNLRTSDYSAWADWLTYQSRQPSIPDDPDGQPRLGENLLPVVDSVSSDAPHLMDSITWNGAVALQQLSVPSTTTPSGGFQGPTESTELLDPSMFTMDHYEDTTFLMGLTGFDMMGFSFQD